MLFNEYTKTIGLSSVQNGSHKLQSIVKEVVDEKTPVLSETQIRGLYTYNVPEVSADGSCSILGKNAEKPYNLAATYGLNPDLEGLEDNPHTERLWRLKQIVEELYKKTQAGWIGIYRKVGTDEYKFLLKEAYKGVASRAEFPLTKEFSKKSNNSTVGLTGKAIVIQNIQEHHGPYYICDTNVQSEFCLPILDKNGKVLGIIDVESPKTGFFTEKILLEFAKVAYDLGQSGLLI